jgi:phosphate starvation-inducible PhoH-like protein
MRGRTFKNTWIIADEAQNCTPSQMKMLLTRLGENSRMVITGDLDQHDRKDEINGLEDFLDKFKGSRSSSITSIEFETKDIEREEVIKEILDIYAGNVPQHYIEDRTPSSSESSKNSEKESDTESIIST